MTTPGIGAASVIGIAFEQLAAPAQTAPATATVGGLIAAGTYKIVVTALNANGETLQSNEQTQVTTGGTSTITVNWGAVAGATGYNIYVTAAGGATNTETKQVTVGVVVTVILTAAIVAGTALPNVNSASTPGTYAAPVKYFPFFSETLKYMQDTDYRRPIRNTAGIVGAVPGDSHVEGDIELEFLSDVAPYFLYATRCTVAKTGTGPFTYVFTPTAAAVPIKTMSITIVRNGVVFGYVGCVVGSFRVTIDDGMLKLSVSLMGRDEAVQSLPTATWPVSTPFGAGTYALQIPTGSAVVDADTFEFSVDDSAVANYRIRSGSTAPAFINFGEETVQLTVNRDFFTRADYDAFKALTAQSISLIATKSGSEVVTILLPQTVKDTYETDIGGEGDLVRASLAYQGMIDGTGKMYQVTVITPTESIL